MDWGAVPDGVAPEVSICNETVANARCREMMRSQYFVGLPLGIYRER